MGRSSGGHILAEITTLQNKFSGGDAESTIDKKLLKDEERDDLKKAVEKLPERPVGLVMYYPVLNLNDSSPHFQRWCCTRSCCGRLRIERDQNMLTWFWKLSLAA